MQKGKMSICLWILLLTLTLVMSGANVAAETPSNQQDHTTQDVDTYVKVIPSTIESYAIGQEFDIAVVVENVTNLWGFDIRFKWNTTYLEYVSHTFTFPIEDFPDPISPSPYPGILYTLSTNGIDYGSIMPMPGHGVNPTAGTVKAAVSCMPPEPPTPSQPPFNGSGTVFVLTLKVKSVCRTLLDIYSSDLAGKTMPLIIPHESQDGFFTNFVPPPAEIYVTPPRIIDSTLTPSSNFTIDINLENVFEFDKFEFWLGYNTTILDISNVTINPMFPPTQSEIQIIEPEGKIRAAGWLQPSSPPVTGNVPLASIVFHVTNTGASTLDLYNVTLLDSWYPYSNEEIPYEEPGAGFFSNMLLTRLFIDPPEIIDPPMLPPETFTIRVKAENTIDMYGYEFKIGYNTAILNALGVIILPPTNDTSFNTTIHLDDPLGKILVKTQYYPPATPITIYGAKALAEIVFQVQSLGATVLDLHNENLTDSSGSQIHVDEVGDGFFMSLVRDVAIINVSAIPSKVYPGRPVTITVVAKNLCNVTTETFNVTVYYDNNTIATQTVMDLGPQENVTLTFNWNTTDLESCDNFTIRAEASQVPYELNVENNLFIDGWVKIKIWGDVDGDGKVDIYDITLASSIYGSSEGDPNWNPEADVAPSWGIINIYDMVTISSHFGQTCEN